MTMVHPADTREQAVLASVAEWQRARSEARSLRLPVHPDPPKSWDTLLALGAIVRRASPMTAVLDAGGERYSALLPSLARYGFRDLVAINPAFRKERVHATAGARIREVPGDATATGWPAGRFGAITCLSVIEHGVDAGALFAEAARLLVPGGVLALSTDYWPEPVDTGGKVAYGVPIRIFDRTGIADLVLTASRFGLHPTSPLDDLVATVPRERAVAWRRFDLHYTFAFLTLEHR